MKPLYALLAFTGLTLLSPAARATSPGTDAPTETTRKATAREKTATAAKAAKAANKSSVRHTNKSNSGLSHSMRVLLGLEASRAVTSPAKRDWQLHKNQNHLRAKIRMEAKARRRRVAHLLG